MPKKKLFPTTCPSGQAKLNFGADKSSLATGCSLLNRQVYESSRQIVSTSFRTGQIQIDSSNCSNLFEIIKNPIRPII